MTFGMHVQTLWHGCRRVNHRHKDLLVLDSAIKIDSAKKNCVLLTFCKIDLHLRITETDYPQSYPLSDMFWGCRNTVHAH